MPFSLFVLICYFIFFIIFVIFVILFVIPFALYLLFAEARFHYLLLYLVLYLLFHLLFIIFLTLADETPPWQRPNFKTASNRRPFSLIVVICYFFVIGFVIVFVILFIICYFNHLFWHWRMRPSLAEANFQNSIWQTPFFSICRNLLLCLLSYLLLYLLSLFFSFYLLFNCFILDETPFGRGQLWKQHLADALCFPPKLRPLFSSFPRN